LAHARAAPRPDRRTDEVDGADALALEPRFEPEVEVGRVHADEGRGSALDEAIAELVAQCNELAIDLQRLGVAMHGEPIARPPGFEAALDHAWAAHSDARQIGPARLHAVQQQPGEQVAGGFPGHHAKLKEGSALRAGGRLAQGGCTHKTRSVRLADDAALRAVEEREQHVDIGVAALDAAAQRLDLLAGLAEREAAAIQQAVHLLDLRDALRREAAPAQPLDVE